MSQEGNTIFNQLINNTDISSLLKGWKSLTTMKKIGISSGIVLSVAVAAGVVLWSQNESVVVLYERMEVEELTEIKQVMNELGFDYKIDTPSGGLIVPADKVQALTLQLASQGLPRSKSIYVENEAMYDQRTLESEIVKTITSIQPVKSARVLLALPKSLDSNKTFKKPSASVVVKLYQGHQLSKGQIDAIVHLVAASVPRLESTDVTVVDQKGRMLSANYSSDELSLTSSQFDYKKNIEEHLMHRIENILTPLVGSEGVKVQVSAEIDFTITDRTQELFYPDSPALNSEQIQGSKKSFVDIKNIPASMFNQPITVSGEISPTDKVTTRHYDVDKTVTRTRLATGVISRLSVAVAIDDKNITSPSYSKVEANQFRHLVMQAVGFDHDRGDQLTVSHLAFKTLEPLEALPELPLWQQDGFVYIAKQVIAISVVLFLIFGIIRPMLRRLIAKDKEVTDLLEAHAKADAIGGVVQKGQDGKPVAVLTSEFTQKAEDLLSLETPESYHKRLDYIQQLIDENPLQVSQIISGWLKSHG